MEWLSMLLATLLSLFGVVPEAKDEAGSVTVALDEAEDPKPLRLPEVSVARGPNRPIVVIDAGHGGRDPGATSPFGGRREKDVTLALARAIRDELVRSGRVRVALTRDNDRYIDLRDRYEIARRVGASLFVSVHADAAPNNDGARGATIYTLSEIASDREAALLAARENQAGLIGGAELSPDPGVNMILIDLALRESMDRSADFARLLHREASPFFPFREQYHRFASLIVLKAPDIPSILFEAGYLTNGEDVAYIHSAEGRQQIATGMRSAIETYFAKHNVHTAAR
jgi:N-acetylmuramoyl-L-alanine amidase